MTEAEWLACDDPLPMLELLRGEVTDRKLRLFAAACARRLCGLLTDERSLQAVVVAERAADGLVANREWMDAESAADDAWMGSTMSSDSDAEREAAFVPYATLHPNAQEAASYSAEGAFTCREYSGQDIAEKAILSNLLRDIFGLHMFHPLKVDSHWLTTDVIAVGRAIYDERAFDRLPILADALEEAGCDNADILNHCRQPGEHVRGCWVVDALLGKE